MPTPPLPPDIVSTVALALAEDVGAGDVTADLVPADGHARAVVVCREAAVLCGRAWFDAVYAKLDEAIRIEWCAEDGADIDAETVVCRLEGPARPLLTGERTALNFLQSLSGTATVARRYADAVAGTGCRVLDTRKTVPGLRSAQKYAVACGGATNHRRGLYDALLIKENHILAAGGIGAALAAARRIHPELVVEIEVESLPELQEALDGGADIVMLDNFALDGLREAVAALRRRPDCRTRLEASGNVELDGIRQIAATGVDFISVGALTKHLRAIDLSMRFQLDLPPRD
ncbi:carboxylating nicotinate-nucleotide diphosphorylase [Wenzhouxiangella sp. XN24]|uniref:carboxylating nicotinate-nucleotide diphosphorylase n=1 Tax=Wenzhouxiangella sp. XN24 TaxID=2713569 RepID=UPI0013EB4263|nr:carboxylating nicotinate-nucleotide diphosphorylase [Wenzhouxiangella sp. XN24]NGX15606.1 carboxylating nicotinate-nucleotide diphosphorylase [Wenzhouxiangella sp. XN24]